MCSAATRDRLVRLQYRAPKFDFIIKIIYNKYTISKEKRYAGLAQLVEHLPYKERVGGSIPSSCTICRSSLMDRQRISTPYYVGSSPTCGAIYAHSSAWTEREATNLGQSGVRISLGVPIYYD